MRFLVIMIPAVYRGNKDPGPGFLKLKNMESMGKFNDDVLGSAIVAMDGLQPLTQGARVAYSNGKATVTDGPYIETKEVFGGYWILEAKSKEDVLNWMKKCPAADGDIIEIRPVFALSDFPVEIQKAFQEKEGGRK